LAKRWPIFAVSMERIERATRDGIAFDPTLDLAVNMIEKHGLRAAQPHHTRPSNAVTKNSEKPSPVIRNKRQPQVLRGRSPAERSEAALRDVEEDGGIARRS